MTADNLGGFTEMVAFGVATTLVLALLAAVTTMGVWKRRGRSGGLTALAASLVVLGALTFTTWQRFDPPPRHLNFVGTPAETLIFIVSDPAGVKVDLSLPLVGTPSLQLDVPANGIVRVANYFDVEPHLLAATAELHGQSAEAQLEVLQDGNGSSTVLCFDFTRPEVPAGEHAARLKARTAR